MRGTAPDYLSNNNRMSPYDKKPDDQKYINKKRLIISIAILMATLLLYNISKTLSNQSIQNITVRQNEIFGIQFDTDKSNGLTWKLMSINNPDHIEFIAETFIPHEDPNITSGIHIFSFKALRSGTSRLLFSLKSTDNVSSSDKMEQYHIIIE